MQTSFLIVIVVCLALLTGACQTQEGSENQTLRSEREVAVALDNMGVAKGDPASNLFNFTVNSFNAINDMNLIVTAGVHDHYLLTLAAPCLNLRYAFTVALISRTSTVS